MQFENKFDKIDWQKRGIVGDNLTYVMATMNSLNDDLGKPRYKKKR